MNRKIDNIFTWYHRPWNNWTKILLDGYNQMEVMITLGITSETATKKVEKCKK